jgi:hypothetical protein
MIKEVSKQLALFAGMAMIGETRGVVSKEWFNKKGEKRGDMITFLPAKSKDKDDMADATGLKGQALKFHNVSVRQSALQTAFGLVSGEVSKGSYMLANGGLKRGVDGTITFKIKPTAIQVVQASPLTDDELLAEAIKRGLVVDPAAKK